MIYNSLLQVYLFIYFQNPQLVPLARIILFNVETHIYRLMKFEYCICC